MAISDSKHRQVQKTTRSRAIGKANAWWSDSQKIEAVKTYLVLGKFSLTEAATKIPETTLRTWAKSEWWAQIVDDLRLQDELVLSAKLKNIVDKTLDVVGDRLENGDYVYDQKTGKMKRKPVSMRDAHKVAMDMSERRDVLLARDRPMQSQEQVADKLLALAEKFAQLGKQQKNLETVVDVTAKELVDDREEAQTDAVLHDVSDDCGEAESGDIHEEKETGTPG